MSISGIGGASTFFTSAGLSRLDTWGDKSQLSETRAAFQAEAEKTPAERMREQMLARLGLKESDLQGMSPEKRQAVEKQLAEMIKQEVEKAAQDRQPGKILDVRA